MVENDASKVWFTRQLSAGQGEMHSLLNLNEGVRVLRTLESVPYTYRFSLDRDSTVS